jgi:hypothetical protein
MEQITDSTPKKPFAESCDVERSISAYQSCGFLRLGGCPEQVSGKKMNDYVAGSATIECDSASISEDEPEQHVIIAGKSYVMGNKTGEAVKIGEMCYVIGDEPGQAVEISGKYYVIGDEPGQAARAVEVFDYSNRGKPWLACDISEIFSYKNGRYVIGDELGQAVRISGEYYVIGNEPERIVVIDEKGYVMGNKTGEAVKIGEVCYVIGDEPGQAVEISGKYYVIGDEPGQAARISGEYYVIGDELGQANWDMHGTIGIIGKDDGKIFRFPERPNVFCRIGKNVGDVLLVVKDGCSEYFEIKGEIFATYLSAVKCEDGIVRVISGQPGGAIVGDNFRYREMKESDVGKTICGSSELIAPTIYANATGFDSIGSALLLSDGLIRIIGRNCGDITSFVGNDGIQRPVIREHNFNFVISAEGESEKLSAWLVYDFLEKKHFYIDENGKQLKCTNAIGEECDFSYQFEIDPTDLLKRQSTDEGFASKDEACKEINSVIKLVQSSCSTVGGLEDQYGLDRIKLAKPIVMHVCKKLVDAGMSQRTIIEMAIFMMVFERFDIASTVPKKLKPGKTFASLDDSTDEVIDGETIRDVVNFKKKLHAIFRMQPLIGIDLEALAILANEIENEWLTGKEIVSIREAVRSKLSKSRQDQVAHHDLRLLPHVIYSNHAMRAKAEQTVSLSYACTQVFWWHVEEMLFFWPAVFDVNGEVLKESNFCVVSEESLASVERFYGSSGKGKQLVPGAMCGLMATALGTFTYCKNPCFYGRAHYSFSVGITAVYMNFATSNISWGQKELVVMEYLMDQKTTSITVCLKTDYKKFAIARNPELAKYNLRFHVPRSSYVAQGDRLAADMDLRCIAYMAHTNCFIRQETLANAISSAHDNDRNGFISWCIGSGYRDFIISKLEYVKSCAFSLFTPEVADALKTLKESATHFSSAESLSAFSVDGDTSDSR